MSKKDKETNHLQLLKYGGTLEIIPGFGGVFNVHGRPVSEELFENAKELKRREKEGLYPYSDSF